MTPTEVRQKAAELIEERGWTQGDYESPNGQLCITGALLRAAGIDPKGPWPDRLGGLSDVARSVTFDLRLKITDDYHWCDLVERLASWNDEYDRTKAEVLGALRGQP